MFDIPNIYALACYTYILTGVICGVVRWCHMCRPYDEHGSFYYPARTFLTFVYLGCALQLPYVLFPESESTWLYVSSLAIVYFPWCFSMLFTRYFRDTRIHTSRKDGLCFYGTLVVIALLLLATAFPLSFVPMGVRHVAVGLAVVTGLLMLGREAYVEHWLRRRIEQYHEQNFSSADDFPYRFAARRLRFPMMFVVLQWAVFLTGNRPFKAFVDVLTAAWMVALLIVCLHPQSPNSKPVAELVTDGDTCYEQDSQAAIQEVLGVILRRCKEPSLKRVEVLADVGYGNKSQAAAFITHHSFYLLVNAFRLRLFERLTEEQPAIKQEAVAMQCGFKDRFALRNARKRLEDYDFTDIDTFLMQGE